MFLNVQTSNNHQEMSECCNEQVFNEVVLNGGGGCLNNFWNGERYSDRRKKKNW